ncbi:hypothetical protein RHS01_10002 [Rhizoctonia solani]|uniref:Uncharacterized protein n=1 Tax=Rhizoctonia solani TaxID=456999 RepID=A0A8H7LXJ4_9AGAM|nr:hypothetical protein RHS01_10002 [Rhizoctonia solani]
MMGTPSVAGTPTLAATPVIGGSGTPTAGATPRPNTPGSMITIHPSTPNTPAIPEFLAASRTTPEELSTPKIEDAESLLTLAISAAAMVGVDVEGAGSDAKTEVTSKTERSVETPKIERAFDFTFPLPDAMKANSPPATSQPETTSSSGHAEPAKFDSQQQSQARPSPSDPSNPRRLSLLERLTARITTPIPDATIEDTTWNASPDEPLIDMDQFGVMDNTWSPTRQSATFPPMASTPKTAFPTSQSAPLSPAHEYDVRSPTNEDPLLPQDPVSPTRPRTRTLSKLSVTGRKGESGVQKKNAWAGMSGDSIPTRLREGGRTMEGTVLYGVGEEMLRLMFANGAASSTEDSEERDQLLLERAQSPHGHVTSSQSLMPDQEEWERERTRSLPRPRASLVSSPIDEDKTPDLDSFSYPSVTMPLNIRPKGHRRGTASKENASLDKSRLRAHERRAPLGVSQQRKSVEVVGILTNGNNSGRTTPNYILGRGAGRVVIVNSATTPNNVNKMGTPTRKTTQSSPVPAAIDAEAGGQMLGQPGVIVTAATPPAPRRSLSMPIEGLLGVDGSESVLESPKATVSRGTSVQFVPESFEGRRKGKRSRKDSANALIPRCPRLMGMVKERERSSGNPRMVPSDTTAKKPRLSVDEMDITFMGEPLFGGSPSTDEVSYNAPYPYPTPTSSPEPEHTSIPMHAILTPRVQSLYGTGAKPDYSSQRQSISSIPRPKSRASARSNATGARSYRSNMTGARSNKTSASQQGPKRWQDKLPLQGWCFLVGFVIPFVWWYAAFSRAEKGYYGGGIWSRDVETQWEGVRTDIHRDDGRIDAHTWRFRCRLMTVLSIVIYVPVIVLAAVFA